MKLTVHLGAHKTASTHLQNILRLASPALQFENICYWDRQGFRADITDEVVVWSRSFSPVFLIKSFFSPAKYSNARSLSKLAETLRQHGKSYEKVILSEENLLGLPNDIYNTDQIYGLVPRRIDTLKALFGDRSVDFCIAIRNPATFLPSIYCEALLLEKYRPFREIYRNRPLHSLSWLPLVTALRDGLGDRSLTIWNYEDYIADKRFIIDWLTGVDTSTWNFLDGETPRVSFSTQAVKHISAIDPRIKDKLRYKKRVEEIVAAYPSSATNPKFQPFSKNMIEQLTVNFKQDLDRISRLSGVTLLKS